MLKVENLSKRFGKLWAVDDLSFDLDEGKICGFVGPNGAGKTTTMRIIATIEEPTHGRVLLDGEPVNDEVYRTRRLVGFMPDHYGTYPSMTVLDYLEFYARAYEVDRKVRDGRIRSIMEFTGLDKLRDKQVEVLSKGQRQRLNLGRALINDPRLLIMDEPAAGLDPRARIELRYLMKNLAERGKTIFVSSHILTELAEICDHLLIIDKGKRITYGSFDEIQRRQQGKLELLIKPLHNDALQGLERFLLERADVSGVTIVDSSSVRCTLDGDRERIPALVRDIVMADFAIFEFRPQMLSMEDVFIQITAGQESE